MFAVKNSVLLSKPFETFGILFNITIKEPFLQVIVLEFVHNNRYNVSKEWYYLKVYFICVWVYYNRHYGILRYRHQNGRYLNEK